jgi:glycosyltransferase involved in cell wall biosynthesis
MLPQVSIITPAYNAAAYVLQTIASVQQQSFTAWEMLIVDDGSTDSTAQLVASEAAKDSRIRLFTQKNGKQGKARNLALKHAGAELICFLDADDIWHEDKLLKQITLMREMPEVHLIYTSGFMFEADINRVIGTLEIESGMRPVEQQFNKILEGYSLPVLSVMVRKDCIELVGGFDEDLRVQNAEDYQLWLKMADAGFQMFGLDERLFYYRVHAKQVTFADKSSFDHAIWALERTNLKRISTNERKETMRRRIWKFLVHNIDTLSATKRIETANLLKLPAGFLGSWAIARVLLMLGVPFLKKYYYGVLNKNEVA